MLIYGVKDRMDGWIEKEYNFGVMNVERLSLKYLACRVG